jgi:hypothetical protein
VERGETLPALEQGKTDANGEIELLGVHDGDWLWARLNLGVVAFSVPSQRLSCPSLMAAADENVPAANEYTLEPDPFRVDVQVQALDASSVRVAAQVTATLASDPIAQVWQTDAAEPLTLSLAYDAEHDLYQGQVALNAALSPEGVVQVDAIDNLARHVRERTRFDLHVVPVNDSIRLQSADDDFELVLPAGSLGDGAVVSIQRSRAGSAEQDNLVRVGSAYQVLVSTGQQIPAVPANVNIRSDSGQLAGVWPGSLRVYHWDDGLQRWILDGGTVWAEFSIVSADVAKLSTFALLGERLTFQYLPLVTR